MKIGLVQYSPYWEDKQKNMNHINILTKDLDPNISLLVFPEMTLTGFTMDAKKYSEEIDGISIKYFIELARNLNTNIICGIIEKEKDEFFNSLFHFDEKGLIKAVYRKIHPFSLADEDKHYSHGKEIVTSKIGVSNLGLSICYDLRFPELYRLQSKENSEIMINIANWPIKRIRHWKALLKARAIENQCYMVGVNRVGYDPYQTYNGCSAVFNPMGEEIVLADNDEKLITADINLKEVKGIRTKLPFLNDIKLI